MAQTGRAEHGVVGIGDSFMHGYGVPLAGLACVSWASWLAWALNTCLTQLAMDGAVCEQVLRDQVPLLQRDHQLGVVWLGTNDIARLDRTRFESQVAALCAAVAQRCDTVALATLPAALTGAGASEYLHDAGRLVANAVLREVATAQGVVLVEVEHALDRSWLMAPDRKHPTALGQLAVAHVAARALDAVGTRFARHLPRLDAFAPTAAEQMLYRSPTSLLRRATGRARRVGRFG